MKIYLLLFSLLLTTSLSYGQCPDCNDDGQITTHLNMDEYTAPESDAYFWEVCSGNALIVGSNTESVVKVDCSKEESVIRLVRFVDGECIESCKIVCETPCECPKVDEVDCIDIQYGECEVVNLSIHENCLPEAECIYGYRWLIKLGGEETVILDTNIPSLDWEIPEGEWDNELLSVEVMVILENGDFCFYSEIVTIDCPVCECPEISQSCLDIELEDCLSAFFTLDPDCLPEPDCIASITWVIGLGHYSNEITNNSTTLDWFFPPPPSGSWTGFNLVSRATITLTNGTQCFYANDVKDLICPPGEPNPRNTDNKKLGADNIYPNPVRRGEYLQISPELQAGMEKIEIININGTTVAYLNKSKSQFQVPSDFDAGTYFLKLYRAEGIELLKIVVQ